MGLQVPHSHPKSLRERYHDFVVRNGTIIVVVGFVILIIGSIVASFVISEQSKTDYQKVMATHASAHAAMVGVIEVNYGATDVHYDGSSLTMTIGDKAFQCEDATREAIIAKKRLRCSSLEFISPVEVTASK